MHATMERNNMPPPETTTFIPPPLPPAPEQKPVLKYVWYIASALLLLICVGALIIFIVFKTFSDRGTETLSDTPTTTGSSTLKYLLFQVTSSGPAPIGMLPSDSSPIVRKTLDDILERLDGERGDHTTTQLGFDEGPLSFELDDERLRQIIKNSFMLAEEKDMAVSFHIDDSMFWGQRKDLWSVKDNVEWTDWKGTIVPHRIISWVANGAKDFLAPPMCWNSPAIIAEVKRRINDVIAPEIVKGADHLKSINKEYLFAGVIAGWETHIQSEGGTHYGTYGYCALHNLGYSAQNPP